MNDQVRNGNSNDAVAGGAPGEAEATLRLIASLPPPQGLEERLHASLAEAPRRGRVLAWPAALNPGSAWMRSAAAAAIVSVVVGGGWGVYSRIPHAQQARSVILAPRGPAQGGFATAGAMRMPQTLNGPVVAHPQAAQPVEDKPAGKGAAPIVRNAPKPPNRAPSASAEVTRIHVALQPAK
jgi:hypothetical protein